MAQAEIAALELYWFDLDAPAADTTRWRAWLSAEERARADRYLFPEHGRRFVAAHAHLRWQLAQRLRCKPAELRFDFGAKGKPKLAGQELHFNLSHSGHYGLLGIAAQELGVDIEAERHRPGFDGLRIARRFFTAKETAWLAALAPDERARGFSRLWTCKEAWLKADGGGMALLSQVEVGFEGDRARLRARGQDWYVGEFELVPGYAAAAVMQTPPATVAVVQSPRR